MLNIENLSVSYGQHKALHEVSIEVAPGEIVVILGANGAGKSSLLKSISGICEGSQKGVIKHNSIELQNLPSDEIVAQGVALVPEGRGIFPELSVLENLKLGAYALEARAEASANLERVFELFPRLHERLKQRAGTMSGGEQQMVAIGRAMMSDPRILMLDEPSLGLSPLLTKELFQNLKRVKAFGLGVLLVEQNARQSLAIADRGYLLENTRIIKQAPAEALLQDPEVQAAYLGAGGAAETDSRQAAKSVASQPAGKAPPAVSETASVPRVDLIAEAYQVRSADQMLGRSIADLVNGAGQVSREGVGEPALTAHNTSTGSSLPGSSVEAIYQDIEQAAKRALERNRRPAPEKPSSGRTTTEVPASKIKQDVPGEPLTLEVYRPPRVEVYHRRDSDTELVRKDR